MDLGLSGKRLRRHRLDRRDRPRDGAAARGRGRAGRHCGPERGAGDRRGAARPAPTCPRPDAPARACRAAVDALGGLDVSSTTSASPDPARFEEVTDERVGRDVAAERDELRAGDPRGAAGLAGARAARSSTSPRPQASGRAAAMPHYSVTKAAVLSLSRLVADLYAATGSAATRSRPGRPRPRPGSAREVSPTSRAARGTRCSRRSAPGGRSAGSPSRRRSPR